MDHNNSEKKYHMCSHNMCKDHDPEWKNIGKRLFVPYQWFSNFFGYETYWSLDKCCGKRMLRCKLIQKQECKKCGSVRDLVLRKEFALCRCCGYHFEPWQYSEGFRRKGGVNSPPLTPRPKRPPCGHKSKKPQS
jgi:hypothetical protein